MRIAKGLVALAIVANVVAVGMPASPAGARYGGSADYLALGDSLAAGFQPGQGDTEAGYVHDLWATFAERIPGLGLRNVGCDGETTRSMLTGTRSQCRYAAGSQLDAAVAFLEGHAGQVAFITIDIGVNDVFERCLARGPLLKRSCVRGVLPHVQARLTRILDALSAAAGPGVPIVAMTYYDPLLGFWGLVPGGRFLARASLRSFQELNAGLTTTYEGGGVAVADVAATFRIDDFEDTIVVAGRGPLPANVALTCRWTWFCSPSFAGDPHPNDKGYRRIAHTIEREVNALLPT